MTEQVLANTFWQTFAEQEDKLAQLPPQDFVEQVNQLLDDETIGISMECSGDPSSEERELILTAHGDKNRFSMVNAFVAAAPALRHFSRVEAFRSRDAAADFEIQMEGETWSAKDYRVGLFEDHGLVGLEVVVEKEVPPALVDVSRHAAFIMLDHLLGEYVFAVRIGAVEFVDSLAADVSFQCSMDQVANQFDEMWLNVLGRTGDWPEESRVSLLQSRPDSEEERPQIISLNTSAGALATRADLAYCLELTFEVGDRDALDVVRDAEERIFYAAGEKHQAIWAVSITDLDSQSRVCRFYTGTPDETAEQAASIAESMGLKMEGEVIFDPSWDGYLMFSG